MIVVDRALSPPPPFLQRWHAITRVAGIHYWQAAGGLRALLASTTVLASSRGVASTTGIGRVRTSTSLNSLLLLLLWQAAELAIVGRRLKKRGRETFITKRIEIVKKGDRDVYY